MILTLCSDIALGVLDRQTAAVASDGKSHYVVEGDKKKSRQAQNLANSKKSTILLQSL